MVLKTYPPGTFYLIILQPGHILKIWKCPEVADFCFFLLNFDDIFINLRFIDEIKYLLFIPVR